MAKGENGDVEEKQQREREKRRKEIVILSEKESEREKAMRSTYIEKRKWLLQYNERIFFFFLSTTLS